MSMRCATCLADQPCATNSRICCSRRVRNEPLSLSLGSLTTLSPVLRRCTHRPLELLVTEGAEQARLAQPFMLNERVIYATDMRPRRDRIQRLKHCPAVALHAATHSH